MNNQTILLLDEFGAALSAGKPRKICSDLLDAWIIFTGAFYEPTAVVVSGAGGVIVSPSGKVDEYFSEPIDNDLATIMGHGTKGSVIFEAELLAVWTAVKLWHVRFSNLMLVVYVDNDALRGAYAASTTRTGFVGRLLEALNVIEERFKIQHPRLGCTCSYQM